MRKLQVNSISTRELRHCVFVSSCYFIDLGRHDSVLRFKRQTTLIEQINVMEGEEIPISNECVPSTVRVFLHLHVELSLLEWIQ